MAKTRPAMSTQRCFGFLYLPQLIAIDSIDCVQWLHNLEPIFRSISKNDFSRTMLTLNNDGNVTHKMCALFFLAFQHRKKNNACEWMSTGNQLLQRKAKTRRNKENRSGRSHFTCVMQTQFAWQCCGLFSLALWNGWDHLRCWQCCSHSICIWFLVFMRTFYCTTFRQLKRSNRNNSLNFTSRLSEILCNVQLKRLCVNTELKTISARQMCRCTKTASLHLNLCGQS